MKNRIPFAAMIHIILALAFGSLVVSPSVSQAVIVVETIVDKPLNNATGYGFTSHYGMQTIFEDFVLQHTATFNRVTWYGLFSEGHVANTQAIGSFDIFFFHNDPSATNVTEGGIHVTDLPTGEAFYLNSASGVLGIKTGVTDPLHGGDIKEWSMDITPVTLDADRYWIAIRAGASEPGYFLWHHTAVGADGYTVHGGISTDNAPHFIVSDEALDRDEMAFSLELVPEPTPLSLLGLGLLALGVARNRSGIIPAIKRC